MKNTSIIITSAEAIGNNPDLLTQILLRLPTKPLLKFKCVSKQWLSLISSPNFCLSHTRHHQTNGVLTPTALILKWFYTLPSEFDVVALKHNSKVPFFDYMNAPYIMVLQSCYGLFLCGSLCGHLLNEDEVVVSSYFVCNPTTKKFKELSFPRKSCRGSNFYVNLAFDPLKSPHYKIICIREVFGKPSKFELDIYSSETDSWRESKICFDLKKHIQFEDAVFCNGKIHWNTYRHWPSPSESLYFDVVNESLEPMPMPTSNYSEGCYFGECRGILYVVKFYRNRFCSEFRVFEIASDYSHWFLKHRLDTGDLFKLFPAKTRCYGSCHMFSDVCIAQFEKEKEPRVVVWADQKVVCYDFEDGAWKWYYDLRPGFDFESYYNDLPEDSCDEDGPLPYASLRAYQYFENLSSI